MVYGEVTQLLLVKHIGELRSDRKPLNFLGRVIYRDEKGIHLQSPTAYVEDMIELLGLQKGKSSGTTCTTIVQGREDGSSQLDYEQHLTYRRMVGKLLWLVAIRPDLSYVSKKLSRSLQSPTQDDYAKAKHAIRYLCGTMDYRLTINPDTAHREHAAFDVTTCVDSDWAGCSTTRKSTTGCTITVAGVAINHYSITQATVALSSGEAELYALSSGTTETIGVLQFLRECEVKTDNYVTLTTDSTASKSMASRLGVSRATKHIQLRFLYSQDLVSTGVVRLRKVDTKQQPR